MSRVTMTAAIIRKEIVANILSYRFTTVMLLLVVLCSCSLFVMYRDFTLRQADYDLIRPKTGEPLAVQPPNPLSIFARGLDESMTRSYRISAIGIEVQGGERSNSALFAFFPTPDFLYVIKVVMSLVALLFGFDQVSREREDGTLRLILSNGIARSELLAGKWLGNLLSLSIPFVLIGLLAFVVLQFDPGIRLTRDGALRFMLILAVSLLYLALFLSLGFLISALTRHAATSLVVALTAWALIVFVLPNLSTLVARSCVDTPSVQALSEKRQQIWTREIVLAIASSRAAPESSQQTDPYLSHFRDISREQDLLEENFRGQFNRLTRLAKGLGRLSPAACLVNAVTDIAGTGLDEAQRFKWAIISYKNRILDDVLAAAMESPHRPIPAFDYRQRSLSEIFGASAVIDVGWLAFGTVMLLFLTHLCFARYDVR